MALATGYHLLGVGVAGFLFIASARVWGKRHLYLLGTVLIIISSAWGGATGTNYKSLLWARIIQGVGLAPFEALVNASVGDMYFVHVRSVLIARFGTRADLWYRKEANAWPAQISLYLVELFLRLSWWERSLIQLAGHGHFTLSPSSAALCCHLSSFSCPSTRSEETIL